MQSLLQVWVGPPLLRRGGYLGKLLGLAGLEAVGQTRGLWAWQDFSVRAWRPVSAFARFLLFSACEQAILAATE